MALVLLFVLRMLLFDVAVIGIVGSVGMAVDVIAMYGDVFGVCVVDDVVVVVAHYNVVHVVVVCTIRVVGDVVNDVAVGVVVIMLLIWCLCDNGVIASVLLLLVLVLVLLFSMLLLCSCCGYCQGRYLYDISNVMMSLLVVVMTVVLVMLHVVIVSSVVVVVGIDTRCVDVAIILVMLFIPR